MAVAVVFTSQRALDSAGRPVDEDGYRAADAEMTRLAERQPGYLGVESARGADGVGITVSYWRSEADARAFGRVARHRDVQARGRRDWYVWYRVRRVEVTAEWGYPGATGAVER